MKFLKNIVRILLYGALSTPVCASQSVFAELDKDYAEFYSADRFVRMAYVFTGASLLASSDADQNIQNDYQTNIRSAASDDFSAVVKTFGEGKYLIPLSLLSAALGPAGEHSSGRSAIANWGAITARAYLTAGPMLLATQRLTGASRPSEEPYQSDWHAFNDSNGVSGHAFIGAVPFITIATMYNDNPYIKTSAYIASGFTALSRVNDNQHYLSQAILGWYLGWEAVDAVNTTDSINDKNYRLQPLAGYQSIGLQIAWTWY
ncbi:MAG: phosphatase PAP2 family protein [Gammaproteobacteria bacterium]|nr:phosphatase PAP2 family protein [Gammaproteobacteria bacterium]